MAVRDVVQAAAGVGGGGEYVEDVFQLIRYITVIALIEIVNNVDLST
jgi:hypothetical protein